MLGAVTPGLGGVIGQKQYQRAAEVRNGNVNGKLVNTGCTGSHHPALEPFVHFSLGRTTILCRLLGQPLTVLMIVQLIYIRNDSYVIDLTLQLRQKVLMAVVAAVISIGLSALLIPRLGIAGLCLGMILGRLTLNISYPFVINKQLERSSKPELKNAVRPAITMTAMFVASAYLGQMLIARSWFIWLLSSGLSFALALSIAVALGLKPESRVSLVKRLRMLRTLLLAR